MEGGGKLFFAEKMEEEEEIGGGRIRKGGLLVRSQLKYYQWIHRRIL
jgi:hypothetical protein